MEYKTIIEADSHVVEEMDRILKLDVGLKDTKYGNKIHTWSAEFENGYFADIAVCNGSNDSSPWIDAILFAEDGSEISCFVPGGDCIGRYVFFEGNDRYIIVITKSAESKLLKACREMFATLEQIDFSSQPVDYDSCSWKEWEAIIALEKKWEEA